MARSAGIRILGFVQAMSADTRLKLDHGTRSLLQEFVSLPDHEVVGEIEATAAVLLAAARFDDYIPLLVHRLARDRLRARLELESLARSA